MSTLYCFQFFLFSGCVHVFTLFTYLVYYSDLISTIYLQEIQPEYDYIIGKLHHSLKVFNNTVNFFTNIDVFGIYRPPLFGISYKNNKT